MNQCRSELCNHRPIRVFVGSSSEDRAKAESVVKGLGDLLSTSAVVTGWWDEFRGSLMNVTFDVLLGIVRHYDFGVFLLTPDDLRNRKARKDQLYVPRDNVVFEMGLFIGRKGRERAIGLWKEKATLPSDWAGLNLSHYKDDDLSFDTALEQIAAHIKKYGLSFDLTDFELNILSLIERLLDLRLNGEEMLKRSFPGSVLRGAAENYELAEKIIKRAFEAGHVIYEASNSENGKDYENMWEKLIAQNAATRTAKVWRLFFEKSDWCKKRLSRLGDRLPTWIEAVATDWPVDILLVAKENETPLEAVIGISSQGNNWMALYSVDPNVVGTLYRYVDSALAVAKALKHRGI